MSLTVTCTNCDKKLKVKDEVAGKKIRCPACSTVFLADAKPKDSGDDFLSDLDDAVSSKRKGRPVDDDLDDDIQDEELPARPSRPRSKPTKKKSTRGKASGTHWLRNLAIAGGVFAGLLFAAMLIPAIIQARKVAGHVANWATFKHPTGLAQIDMPGTPLFDAQQSINGAQIYLLKETNFQMSLSAVTLPEPARMVLASNPSAVDLMFNEILSKTPQSMPGSKVVSSRRLTSGSIPGFEIKMENKGILHMMQFYLVPEGLIGAEYITKQESRFSADRDRFFNSMRGPDGSLINGPGQSTNVPPATTPPTASATVTTSKPVTTGSLTDARKTLKTNLVRPIRGGPPANVPPPSLARLIKYDSPNGKLAAYVTTIPPGGKRNPAIVWISGGDCNTIDDGFFQDSPPSNDQTASAFRKAGIVTMYVSLRGGNDNPGFKEGFLGEVDDVLAAADFLSKMDGIDPSRIYLGGHSTGGTLALLAAESTNNFRAIFSFGPVDDIRGYGDDYIYFDSRVPAELEARTPSRWLHAIKNRTFVLEGSNQGNVQALLTLKNASSNSQISFHPVAGANHFNILAPVTQKIAEKILQDQGPTTNITITEDDLNLKYER